jgi:anti-anti-sigma factor
VLFWQRRHGVAFHLLFDSGEHRRPSDGKERGTLVYLNVGMTMSEKPDIVIRREAGCVVVEFAVPRISEGTIVEAIQTTLTQLIENDPQQKIVIDFQRVELMSSATLGVLVRFYRDLAENGGRIVLCGLQPPVQKVFELTRLDQLFRIEKDLAAGLSRLAG